MGAVRAALWGVPLLLLAIAVGVVLLRGRIAAEGGLEAPYERLPEATPPTPWSDPISDAPTDATTDAPAVPAAPWSTVGRYGGTPAEAAPQETAEAAAVSADPVEGTGTPHRVD